MDTICHRAVNLTHTASFKNQSYFMFFLNGAALKKADIYYTQCSPKSGGLSTMQYIFCEKLDFRYYSILQSNVILYSGMYGLLKVNQRCGRTYSLHLQGQRTV
jgi:hypothetical protein